MEPNVRPFEMWAILEINGHRKLAGWLSVEQVAGVGMIRIDIPGHDDTSKGPGPITQYYHPNMVYAITPTTEALARGVAQQLGYAPISRWDLPESMRQVSAIADAEPRRDFDTGYKDDDFDSDGEEEDF